MNNHVSDLGPSAIAASFGLTKVGVRPSLWRYLREIWARRVFASTLATFRIDSSNQRDRLGLAWVILKPLLNAVVYGTVFGWLILPGDTRPENFVAFLLVGVFLFEFFNASLSEGSKAITSNAQLVQSLSFPRILLPIAVVIEQIYRLIPMVIVLLVLIVILGERPKPSWLLLIPVLLLMTLFNAGVAFLAARISVHIRDLQQMIPFITRFIFYTSSIFFSIDLVLAEQPTLLAIAKLNPVYEFIQLARDVLIDGAPVDPILWTWAPMWAVATFVIGTLFFWHAEERYGRDL